MSKITFYFLQISLLIMLDINLCGCRIIRILEELTLGRQHASRICSRDGFINDNG